MASIISAITVVGTITILEHCMSILKDVALTNRSELQRVNTYVLLVITQCVTNFHSVALLNYLHLSNVETFSRTSNPEFKVKQPCLIRVNGVGPIHLAVTNSHSFDSQHSHRPLLKVCIRGSLVNDIPFTIEH